VLTGQLLLHRADRIRIFTSDGWYGRLYAWKEKFKARTGIKVEKDRSSGRHPPAYTSCQYWVCVGCDRICNIEMVVVLSDAPALPKKHMRTNAERGRGTGESPE
jgi:hypothetical protein